MSGPNLTLTLDDFEFQSVEIPASIAIGGRQNLVLHDLIGGARVIDAMGAFSEPLAWSGMFLGENALQRARYLDAKRAAGKVLTLTWSELRYQVVIREFKAEFRRSYEIPYSIVCEVVEDEALPVDTLPTDSVDSLVSQDVTSGGSLVLQLQALPPIQAGPVTTSTMAGAFMAVQSAIDSVSSFAKATQSQLNSVLQPLAALRTQVQTLTAAVNNTLSNITTLGGILPNNPLSKQVARLGSQVAALQQQPLLLQLDRVVGRIGVNAQASYKTAKQVTQAGGNLYQLAATEYADASAWTGLAKANALSDPMLDGINTLTVPPTKDTSGGVLEY